MGMVFGVIAVVVIVMGVWVINRLMAKMVAVRNTIVGMSMHIVNLEDALQAKGLKVPVPSVESDKIGVATTLIRTIRRAAEDAFIAAGMEVYWTQHAAEAAKKHWWSRA